MDSNFWKVKSMQDFTPEEWEQICLKCGKCCCHKTYYGNSVLFYNRVCDNLDLKTGLCKNYENRLCDDCLEVNWQVLCKNPELLPEECAYRMLKEKGCLPEYHPLITGDSESVKKANQTVLDWEKVHNFAQIKKIVDEVAKETDEKGWSMEKYADTVNERLKNYPLLVTGKYKR